MLASTSLSYHLLLTIRSVCSCRVRVTSIHTRLVSSLSPSVDITKRDQITMEEKNNNTDVESGPTSGKGPQSVSHWRLVIDQSLVTPEVQNWKYNGSGTDEDPYVSV